MKQKHYINVLHKSMLQNGQCSKYRVVQAFTFEGKEKKKLRMGNRNVGRTEKRKKKWAMIIIASFKGVPASKEKR